MEEMEYDVFLSYNHKDKEWVENLAGRIESEQHEGRKLRVFLDTRDIRPGSNMVDAMEKGLAQSRHICPVISPNSIDAEWPRMEWTIAISSDPSGRKGRVIPLWLGGCEIPPSLKIRFAIYFDSKSNSAQSYKTLISRLTSGTTARSTAVNFTASTAYPESFPIQYEDDVDEQLLSNLFPTSHMPEIVWHGPTKRTKTQIYRHLERACSETLPTFIIKSGQIFCFWDLRDPECPFRGVLSANVIEHDDVADWLDDAGKSRWLVELLNIGLKNHCKSLSLRFDDKHARFMFRPHYGTDRQITWNTGKRRSTRTVVKKYVKPKVFWAHHSLRAGFMCLDRDVFLQLDPGWTFTSNGETPLPKEQTGRLSVRWTAHERNASMSYHIRFWSSYLSQSSKLLVLNLGGSACKIHTTPGIANMNKGLEDDIMPIDKVFETGHKEIADTEKIRDAIAEDETLEIGSVEGDEDE